MANVFSKGPKYRAADINSLKHIFKTVMDSVANYIWQWVEHLKKDAVTLSGWITAIWSLSEIKK